METEKGGWTIEGSEGEKRREGGGWRKREGRRGKEKEKRRKRWRGRQIEEKERDKEKGERKGLQE